MSTVKNNETMHRFETDAAGDTAVLEYRVKGRRMVLLHTGVPEAAQGKGVGGDLLRAAFEHARAEGLKVEPRCTFAAAWVRRHTELADMVEWE